jgi:hypothetical protein
VLDAADDADDLRVAELALRILEPQTRAERILPASSTIATPGASASSFSVNTRPRRSGIPSVAK